MLTNNEKEDKCLDCEIFKQKQQQVLSTCDSIFDAAYDLSEFTKECKLTCSDE